MRLAAVCTLLAAAACGEPQIAIVLSGTNPAGLDTSCVAAVDMWVYGKSYDDDSDLKYACHEIDPGAMTAADVKRAITDKFDILIPASGLLGVELEAHSGPCRTVDDDNLTASDLIFTAAELHTDGSDELVLPIAPIASCEASQLRVRPVEVMALLRTKDCAMATFVNGSIQLGTMAPSLLDGPFYWSGQNGATLTAATATVGGLPNTADVACLAGAAGDATGLIGSTSCVHRATADQPGVCALANEIELAIMDTGLALGMLPVDKINRRNGVVIGAVWSGTGAARLPVAGATVEIAGGSAVGEVFYVSVNAQEKLIETPGATMTGPSGMFVALVDTVTDITVSSAMGTRTVKIGAENELVSVHLIQM